MANESRRQTVEQERASAAWDCVQSVPKNDAEYRSWAQKLPAMIMGNGLAPTLAFLKAKGRVELYGHLQGWLCKRPNLWTQQQQNDLVTRLIHESSSIYRQVTVEALAFCTWLKRFAEAHLEKKEGGS